MEPTDPLQAVTHGDPYPFYARLRAGPPLAYDAALGLWVASRAQVLDELFTHPTMRVRPVAEPVPAALASRPAGEVFARLVRMNDGTGHQPAKRVVEQVLAGAGTQDVERAATRIAVGLLPRAGDAEALNRWLFDVPVRSVAALLGFSDEVLGDIAAATRAFVACLSHFSTPEQLADAHTAAKSLGERVARLAEEGGTGIAAQLHVAAQAEHWDDTQAITANLVGLLSQTYEATAGLIGNSLVVVSRHPDALAQASGDWLRIVRETARFDSPVQNTRRFAAEPTVIAGVDLPAGAPVLLVLAAANRDPQTNPQPDVFDPQRAAPRLYSFSRGAHACPGQEMACLVAAAALRALHDGQARPDADTLRWSYRPSTNGRLPVFH